MGVDCYIETDSKITGLDRWYVFSEHFESGREYGSLYVIEKIKIIKTNLPDMLDLSTEDRSYYIRWCENALKIARNSISGFIIFYTTNDLCDNKRIP